LILVKYFALFMFIRLSMFFQMLKWDRNLNLLCG
jgi:hypothetical protein